MDDITIRFENVSKKYQLGLTRMSLPSMIRQWMTSTVAGKSSSAEKKVFWALRDVSFDVRKSDALALIGANGAGKTTALKLLANITKPTSGQIKTTGQLSALIELGAGFHPDLTGRENIYLNGTILGLSRRQIDDHLDEIIAFSELEKFIDTPIKRYSSGMAVRLGFAVSSCIQPDILLVDEVLAVGDAAFQQKCMQRIHALIEMGTSILFVSHNFYLVQAVCNRAIYIDQGQIKYSGSVKDAITIYEQDLHAERARRFERSESLHGPNSHDVDLEITQVEVKDASGGDANPLSSNEPVEIRIHYRSYQSIGKVNISVFIRRSDGLTCCMLRSKLDNFTPALERSESTISVYLEPLQLVGGSYFAEAWFLNESDSMTLIPSPARSDWFSVRGTALSYTEDSGVFHPKTSWVHHPHGRYIVGDALDGPLEHASSVR